MNSSAQANTDTVPRKASHLIHAWNFWGFLTEEDTSRLRCFWALLTDEEQIHLENWTVENKGKLPPFIRVRF